MVSSIELGIDIETFSSVDIKNGAYAYAEAPDFEILLISYKFSDEDMLWMLDTIVSYYYDSGVLESDDEEVAIDLESVADYVCSAAESERGEKIDRGDVFFIVEADLDFQEENA